MPHHASIILGIDQVARPSARLFMIMMLCHMKGYQGEVQINRCHLHINCINWQRICMLLHNMHFYFILLKQLWQVDFVMIEG
jgi:hypothetical protein